MAKAAGSLYFLCDIMKYRPTNGRATTEVSTAAIIRCTVYARCTGRVRKDYVSSSSDTMRRQKQHTGVPLTLG